MRALTWHGPRDLRMETVPDPAILNPRDVILEVTAAAVCGADLQLAEGLAPGLRPGDILGREFMGRVVEAGRDSPLRPGARVVVPSVIACGRCYFCRRGQFAACDNSNPAETQAESAALYGQALSGAFGQSRLSGGYPGGQAEFVRVPFSDVGPLAVPDGLEDEQVLFLSDSLPAGWSAALDAGLEAGDTVAIWGAGPVGLFALQAALLLGAGRAIVIDALPRRLELARGLGAETLDPVQTDVLEALAEMTGGVGPDAAIEATGMEAPGLGLGTMAADARRRLGAAAGARFGRIHGGIWGGWGEDRGEALRQAIRACRKGGRLSAAGTQGGIQGGALDRSALAALMHKGVQLRAGPAHVQRHAPDLLRRIEAGEIDATFLISHRLPLEAAPRAYANLRARPNDWIKATLRPAAAAASETAAPLGEGASPPRPAPASDS